MQNKSVDKAVDRCSKEYDAARHDLLQVLQIVQGLLDITTDAVKDCDSGITDQCPVKLKNCAKLIDAMEALSIRGKRCLNIMIAETGKEIERVHEQERAKNPQPARKRGRPTRER